MATALVKNPVIDPRYACFRLEIRASVIDRRGVYALQRIPPRRKVIEYTGERISRGETKKRGTGRITYLFTLDNYWTIDGAFGGSGAEIINHSCDPNLYASIQKGHILYLSKRTIKPGEELTIDYRFGADIEMVKCRCGAKNCRGVINWIEPKKKRARKS
jgi:SET domain-containing protein